MATRKEGVAVPNWRQGQEQPQCQDAVREKHIHLNWSNFKPEFSGKPEEDTETHLKHSNDWMDAHHFNEDIKVQKKFSLTDQKKQPCLAVETCQLKYLNQFCIRESLQIEYRGFVLHCWEKQDYSIIL